MHISKVRQIARRVAAIALIPASVAWLQGCAGAAVGAGVGAANTVPERRTAGEMAEDEMVEYRVLQAIGAEPDLQEVVHVNAISINGRVLLLGEVPTQEMLTRVEDKARNAKGVREVYNEILVSAQTTMLSRTNDTVLTGRVKTALLSQDFAEANRVKVVTERSTVYLMGVVTRDEADRATEIARNVGGVLRVVRLFEYVD